MAAVEQRVADDRPEGSEPAETVLQIPSEGQEGENVADDKPPDYDGAPERPPSSSLIVKVREARKEPGTAVTLLRSLCRRIETTVAVTYVLGVSVVLPIAMLIMGVIHLKDCPAQKYIPIYMLVGGIFGVGKLLMDIVNCTIKIRNTKRNTTTEKRKEVGALDGLVSCFLVAWFITGCVWIYGAYLPEFADPHHPDYCNKGLYYFAFGVVTSTLVILGLFILAFCCIGVVLVVVVAKGSTES